jgi:hypothetical protein
MRHSVQIASAGSDGTWGATMQRLKDYLRHSGHLWLLFLLIVAAAVGYGVIRGRLVPATYGDQGAYRAAALTEIAARPSKWQSDQTCLECHQNVAKEREGSLHEAVRCFHCHGVGTKHTELARLAAKSPGTTIPPAQKWDGNFLTTIDLYLTKDKATCLSCHQDAVGMPAKFKKINQAQHLEEMGASEPKSAEVCAECHAGHNTAP